MYHSGIMTDLAPRASRQVILFLASDPTDAARLRLGQEMRDIEAVLRAARMREDFQFESRTSVRPTDITQAIFDTRPRVVHFSGHGTEDGELCFESPDGKVQPVSQDALADLFKLLKNEVRCVVLNACFSEQQARSIAKYILFVVGMSKAMGESAAIVFAAGFYKGFAGGRSIRESFDFGIVDWKLLSIPDSATPVILEGPSPESMETGDSPAGMKYKHYVYISETKVNMMYSQLSPARILKLADDAGIDRPPVSCGSDSGDKERALLTRLAIVNRYIESELSVGTAMAPEQFVKDTLPMKWGPYSSEGLETGGLRYFWGRSGRTVIGFGGSSHPLIRSAGKYHAHYHSAT